MFIRILPFLLLAACTTEGGPGKTDVDSDLDGLFDQEEATLGTDPTNADSDADYLSDGEEATLGTDPLTADSDGDGYLDGDETLEGSDPLDADSRIYAGGWPYNRNKDALTDPGFDGHAKEGKVFPRTDYVDQFGETVDIYDYAGHGKPIVVDVSAEWCSYCQELAKELEGKRNYFTGYWPDLQALVDNGDILWVTVLAEDSSGRSTANATADAVVRWADTFEQPRVAVTADEDYELFSWVNVNGFPWLMLLDDTMTVTVFDSRSNNMAPLDAIEQMVADGELPAAE